MMGKQSGQLYYSSVAESPLIDAGVFFLIH